MPGQADVEQDDLGARVGRGRERRGAVVGDHDLVAARPAAAGRGSPPRRRCRRRPARGARGERARRRRSAGGGGAPGPSRTRQARPRSALPWPGAVAVRRDAAAVQLDQRSAPASGRCPGRPASGRELRSRLGEQVEDARQQLGRDADAGVAARVSIDARRRRWRASEPDVAARGRVLGRVVEQVGERPASAASGRRRARRAAGGSVDRAAGGARASISGRAGLDRRVASRRASVERLACAAAILPARDARDVEQVVDQPGQVLAPGGR